MSRNRLPPPPPPPWWMFGDDDDSKIDPPASPADGSTGGVNTSERSERIEIYINHVREDGMTIVVISKSPKDSPLVLMSASDAPLEGGDLIREKTDPPAASACDVKIHFYPTDRIPEFVAALLTGEDDGS